MEECGNIGVHREVRLLIRFTDYPGPDITVLDRTLGESRQIQYIALESDEVLDQVIAYLTDGYDGRVETRVETASGACSGSTSEDAFFPFKTGLNDQPIDFAGYLVDAFEVRLDEVLIESPGSDPNGDGNWTEVSIRGALSVYGEFPYWPTVTHMTTRVPTQTPSPSATLDPDLDLPRSYAGDVTSRHLIEVEKGTYRQQTELLDLVQYLVK